MNIYRVSMKGTKMRILEIVLVMGVLTTTLLSPVAARAATPEQLAQAAALEANVSQTCKDSYQNVVSVISGSCTKAELDALSDAKLLREGGITNAEALAGKAPNTPATCTNTTSYAYNFGTCLWRTIISGLGALLISTTAFLLTLSGLLFNWLIDNTIILFKTNIYDKLATGIETTWTVFRDLANIAIIGIFVFIAISIILGIKQFGEKRLVANVLIVAVLINFSLLFTKVIIDGSNYMALQFYTASTGQTMSQAQAAIAATGSRFSVTGTGADLQQFPQEGIAGSFVKILGVTTLSDTYDSLNAIAQRPDGGAMAAFSHGLFGAILLLGAAIVLLYGSYLVVVRAVLLLFLLITSGLAFASYLLPKSIRGEFGWSTWWSSLLKATIFAPMLMLFLWMTLTLATAINQGKSGTLGNLVTNPGKAADLGALFIYIIVLALLFAAFRVSSSFTNTIAGFNWASTLTAMPLTLASQHLLGPLGRQLFGRGALARSLALGKDIEAESQKQASVRDPLKRDYSRLTQLINKQSKEEALAKSSFNMMNNKTLQSLATGLGVKSFALGADKKPTNAYDASKAKADEIAKKAVAGALSQEASFEAATAEIQRKSEPARKDLIERQERAADKMVKAAETHVESRKGEIETMKTQLEIVRKEAHTKEVEANKAKAEIDRRHAAGEISDAERSAGMRAEDAKIARVKESVQIQEKNLDLAENPPELVQARKEHEEATRALEDHDKSVRELIKTRATEIRAASQLGAQEVAKKMSGHDANVAAMARSAAKKKIGAKPIKDRRAAERDELSSAGELEEEEKK